MIWEEGMRFCCCMGHSDDAIHCSVMGWGADVAGNGQVARRYRAVDRDNIRHLQRACEG